MGDTLAGCEEDFYSFLLEKEQEERRRNICPFSSELCVWLEKMESRDLEYPGTFMFFLFIGEIADVSWTAKS